MAGMSKLDALVERLKAASFKERDAIKAELLAEASSQPDARATMDHLEQAKRGLPSLELRWEVDEVIEAITPPPEPPPEPEVEADQPNRPLTAADLDVVYDDPRGLLLHKSKRGNRWFVTQPHPQTGQPQTFELHPQEVAQIKKQLAGSPYWVLGAGGAA
jgi:hypothetical protein